MSTENNQIRETINLQSCFEIEPDPLDFVWSGFVAGSIGVIAAAGSTGKSFWAMEAGMGVVSAAANKSLLDLDIKSHGRVTILNAEDPTSVLNHRIHAIGKLLSREARDEVIEGMALAPLVGCGVNIMDDEWLDSVCGFCEGSRLVILDTHSRWSAGVPENDNSEQAQVLQRYETVAKITGAAVLFPHHVGKSSALSGAGDVQQAARGAAAIIDNCRWAGYLQTMTPEQAAEYHIDDKEARRRYVSFGGSKENYGEDTPDCWLLRCDGGVLKPAEYLAKKTTPREWK